MAVLAAAVFGYAAVKWFSPEESPANDNAVKDQEHSGVFRRPEPVVDPVQEQTREKLAAFMRLTRSDGLGDPDALASEARAAWESTPVAEREIYLDKERFADPNVDGRVPAKMWMAKFLMTVRMRANDVPVELEATPVSDPVEIPVTFEEGPSSSAAAEEAKVAPPDVDPVLKEKLAEQIAATHGDVGLDRARQMTDGIFKRWNALPPEIQEALAGRSLLDSHLFGRNIPQSYAVTHSARGKAVVLPQEWLRLEVDRQMKAQTVEKEIQSIRSMLGNLAAAKVRLGNRSDSNQLLGRIDWIEDEMHRGSILLRELKADRIVLSQGTPELFALIEDAEAHAVTRVIPMPEIEVLGPQDIISEIEVLGPQDIISQDAIDPVLAALPPSMDGVKEHPLKPGEGTSPGLHARNVVTGALDAVAAGPQGEPSVSSPAMAVGNDAPVSLPPTVRPGALSRATAVTTRLPGASGRLLLNR